MGFSSSGCHLPANIQGQYFTQPPTHTSTDELSELLTVKLSGAVTEAMTDKKRFVNVTNAAYPTVSSGLHGVHSSSWNGAKIRVGDRAECWPLLDLSPLHPLCLPVLQPEGETPPHPLPTLPLLLASTSMADSRQPEDGAPQWDPSGGQEPTGTHGANGYSASAYRTCQPGGAHMATASYSARENGFNGELTGAHAITAGKMSS